MLNRDGTSMSPLEMALILQYTKVAADGCSGHIKIVGKVRYDHLLPIIHELNDPVPALLTKEPTVLYLTLHHVDPHSNANTKIHFRILIST